MLKSEFLDLMENAHEELIFLKGFLMDLFRQNTELGKLENLLTLAEVASHKATSTSTCSYESFMDGSSTREVPDFLQEIESVKVDALLCKDQTQITDILPLVQSVTTEAESFVNPPIQYIECKKQNDLLADIGTLAIEAEAAIRLSYEDALESRQSRKVSTLLHLLTAVFKLIKSERNLTDLLMHKATLEAQVLDLMENAHGELIFLRVFLMDFLRHRAKLDKVDDLLMRAEVSADKLISNCSYESTMVGRNTGEMSLSLSDFIQEIKSVNVEVRELCFQFLDESASHITVTDLKCLINMLSYMLKHLHSWGDVISIVRNQIETGVSC
ncbi:hypothetical protein RND71_010402 [Anisodus tanguticus]|uniref:Uncharacterized protein n=1 Tax=Anisodus tanguticus TaxID=243964 RepID=A0AAE1VJ39_9SOLA|nr:hypothetical protein RND71_010402 [Anisodus tanguticus]